MSRLEITEVVLVHFNLANNDCQQDSRISYTFVPNKPFGSLLDIKIWFTDQNSKPLKLGERINLTLITK